MPRYYLITYCILSTSLNTNHSYLLSDPQIPGPENAEGTKRKAPAELSYLCGRVVVRSVVPEVWVVASVLLPTGEVVATISNVLPPSVP